MADVDAQLRMEIELYRGYSAYEVAVHKGFTGTEADWLMSLKGNTITVNQKTYDEQNNVTVYAEDICLSGEDGTTIPEKFDLVAEQFNQALADKLDNQRGDELTVQIAGKASTALYSATLTASGWSGTAPRKQTVNVAGILATDTPFVDINMSGATTGAAGTALTDAWTLVGRVETGAGNVTAYCYDDVPTVDLPIVLKVVR